MAKIKLEYSKTYETEEQKNYLLDSRMKALIENLNEYSYYWKVSEKDNYKFTDSHPRDAGNCLVKLSKETYVYRVSCIMDVVLIRVKSSAASVKSAHVDGW